MTEPIGFYGSNKTAALCGLNNLRLVAKIGPPDSLVRYGTLDCNLWSCERVMEYALSRKWTPGPDNPPTFYTIPEACRYTGITRMVFGRIIGKTPAPAIQVGERRTYACGRRVFSK